MEAKSLETLQAEHRHGFIAQHPLLFWADTVGDGSITKKELQRLFFRMSLSMCLQPDGDTERETSAVAKNDGNV